jgi:prolipoprotein diacylglyceryltransferase
MGIFEETYGLPTFLPWGMDLGDGVPRHPAAIYEILFLLGIWIGVGILERKFVFREGSYFKIFMIAYLLFRFLLDFIKPNYQVILGLSAIQLACVGGLIYYFHDIRYLNRMIIKHLVVHG